VVACYNEEEALPAAFQTIIPELEAATAGSWRILLVDPGSGPTVGHFLDYTIQPLRREAEQKCPNDSHIYVLGRHFAAPLAGAKKG
jgi:hypothetical protein